MDSGLWDGVGVYRIQCVQAISNARNPVRLVIECIGISGARRRFEVTYWIRNRLDWWGIFSQRTEK